MRTLDQNREHDWAGLEDKMVTDWTLGRSLRSARSRDEARILPDYKFPHLKRWRNVSLSHVSHEDVEQDMVGTVYETILTEPSLAGRRSVFPFALPGCWMGPSPQIFTCQSLPLSVIQEPICIFENPGDYSHNYHYDYPHPTLLPLECHGQPHFVMWNVETKISQPGVREQLEICSIDESTKDVVGDSETSVILGSVKARPRKWNIVAQD
ncbi:hypothetical protein BS17DRAFT_766184 [Gyrodon lividus]|nr:hypothetical protein BS17DRAFT_766184 [Gyrodon lividus]